MESKSAVKISPVILDSSFTKEVMKMRGGENVLDCFQCGVCNGDCPTRFAMDFTPMQIVRMVHLGMKEKVFSSSTIWICASCYTCTTRCPRGIDIPVLMSALKNVALREKIPSKIEAKPKFYRLFADNVKKYGRVREAELFMKLMKKSDIRGLMHSAILAFRLWRKGKLSLRAPKIGQTAQLSTIFENALKEER